MVRYCYHDRVHTDLENLEKLLEFCYVMLCIDVELNQWSVDWRLKVLLNESNILQFFMAVVLSVCRIMSNSMAADSTLLR